MRVFGIASFAMVSPAMAVEMSQLAIDYNKHANLPPDVKRVVGRCEGRDYYSESQLQGCQRNVEAARLHHIPAGDPQKNDTYRPIRDFSTNNN